MILGRKKPHDISDWEWELAMEYVPRYMRRWQSLHHDMDSLDMQRAFGTPILWAAVEILIDAELIIRRKKSWRLSTYHCEEYSFC